MTTLTRLRVQIATSRTLSLPNIMIVIWVLAMIALPILKWTFGKEIIPTAVTGALLIQCAAVISVLTETLSWRSILVMFTTVAVSTWGLEFIGSSTGFPFGSYDYTSLLQPQIGHVPLLVPLAWFMMLPCAWAVASMFNLKHPVSVALVASVAMTAWDLFLDPQMVQWGFWVWESPKGYFGIPWSNYGGWLLTGFLVTLVVRPHRYNLPQKPLIFIYGIVWFLQSIGLAIFWGQPGPALVGSVVMGAILFLAIRKIVCRGQS